MEVSKDIMIKRKSRKRKVLIALVVVLTAIVTTLAFLWNHYLNKNTVFAAFESPQGQETYILGTWHDMHFNKWLNYSMEDILSVVENVQPDIVFIEAREEYFEEYGVMDGPIDMAVVYAYCVENAIPVKMIDWWVVDNESQSNSTTEKRDDMIFNNINNELAVADPSARVLIVCGASHYHAQSSRFIENGYSKQSISNISDFFNSTDSQFQYPSTTSAVWEKRAYFYAYIYPDIIGQDDTLTAETKANWTDGDHDAFYKQQLSYCDLLDNNELFEA